MKSKLFFAPLLLATALYTNAQTIVKIDAKEAKQSAVKSKATKKTSATRDDAKTNQTQQTYTRPDAKQRRKRYVKSLVGPVALARTVVSAGYSTWRNSPVEWGDKWEGFGRRLASGFGKNAIKQTTIYALDESFKLDSAFYRSTKRNVGARLGNALVSPFTARKPDGKRVFGFPRIAGTYASSIIAYETWYPDRFGFKDGLKNGTISLGFNAAFNVFKEFVWKK